jgi:hypothetical protein
MRTIRLTCLAIALSAAAVLTGCGSSGIGDILGGGSPSGGTTSGGSTSDGRYDPAVNNVRGTVDRVDTVERRILVTNDGTYDDRYNLRNGTNGNNENRQVALYYDDRTTVEYQGKTYRPQDLESGDRILANVNDTGSRLIAEDIQVLEDVTGNGVGSGSNDRTSDLRGTVRYIDTRDRTVEIEPSRSTSFSTSRSGLVVVHYDANTVVEYQGQRYKPENLEQGDVVELQIRDLNGQLTADQILVVADAQGR